jgi:hypothetical protein
MRRNSCLWTCQLASYRFGTLLNILSFQLFLQSFVVVFLRVLNVFVKLFHNQRWYLLIGTAEFSSRSFLVNILTPVSHSFFFQ